MLSIMIIELWKNYLDTLDVYISPPPTPQSIHVDDPPPSYGIEGTLHIFERLYQLVQSYSNCHMIQISRPRNHHEVTIVFHPWESQYWNAGITPQVLSDWLQLPVRGGNNQGKPEGSSYNIDYPDFEWDSLLEIIINDPNVYIQSDRNEIHIYNNEYCRQKYGGDGRPPRLEMPRRKRATKKSTQRQRRSAATTRKRSHRKK
jgi:hypothetical protein